MFAIGEHDKTTMHLRRRLHITAIHGSGEGVPPIHAHPSGLNDQGVGGTLNFGQQLLWGGGTTLKTGFDQPWRPAGLSQSPLFLLQTAGHWSLHSARWRACRFQQFGRETARFGKVCAPRVEKLIEDLQAVAKTANLEIYEFDDSLVKKLFVELARRFRATAHRFGIEFEITVEGEAVE